MKAVIGPALLATCLTAATPVAAAMRTPSCELLIAFGFGGSSNSVAHGFGVRIDDLTVSDFDTMLEVVEACTDAAKQLPPEVPALMARERKSVQINVFSMMAEEIRFYRSRARERERDRRAVK